MHDHINHTSWPHAWQQHPYQCKLTIRKHKNHVTNHTLMMTHSTTTPSLSHDNITTIMTITIHMQQAYRPQGWVTHVKPTWMHDQHTLPIQSKGWTMLWYHSITPSSHIYPSNWSTRVNMRQEATIMGFNHLGDFKEVELRKIHNTNLLYLLHDSHKPS